MTAILDLAVDTMFRHSRVAATLRHLMYVRDTTQRDLMSRYARTGTYPQRDFTHFDRFRGKLIDVYDKPTGQHVTDYNERRRRRLGVADGDVMTREKRERHVRWVGPTMLEVCAHVVVTGVDFARVVAHWEEHLLGERRELTVCDVGCNTAATCEHVFGAEPRVATVRLDHPDPMADDWLQRLRAMDEALASRRQLGVAM